jgi:hypothetical protein
VTDRQRRGQWIWFDPIYRVNVALLNCPAEQAKSRLARVLPEDTAREFDDALSDLVCDGRFVVAKHPTTGLIVVIWTKPDADAAVVAHEAFHATCEVMRQKGLSLKRSSEEAYAYWLEWLMREISSRRSR